MEKFKKFFKSAFLTLSICTFMLVSIPIAHADIVGFFLSSALGILQGASDDLDQINAAKYTLYHSWSDNTYNSTSHLTKISGDALSSIVGSLTSSGCPCEVVYSSSIAGTGVSGYWIVCTGEPFFVNRSAYSRIDTEHTYTGKHLGLFNYSATYNSEFYFYSEHMPSTYYLKNIYDRIDSIWNWGQSGGLLTNINTACTLITNALTTANSWLGNIAGYVDGVEAYLSSQSSKLSNIQSYTNLTAARLLYTDSNNNSYSVGAMVYRIWQAMPTPQDYSSTLDLIRQHTLLTSNRLLYESGDVRMSAGAMLYDLRTYASRIADRTLNTANRLQTTVNGTTYTTAELLYTIANSNVDYTMSLSSINSKLTSSLTHLSNISDSVDGLESAFSSANSHLQNIANRTLNTVSRLDTVNTNLTTISNKLDDIGSDFDSQGIIDAIDRIYDWLDNADLATNSAIQDLANTESDSPNIAVGFSNRIKKLFRHVFDDIDNGYSLSDWSDAAGFFDMFSDVDNAEVGN